MVTKYFTYVVLLFLSSVSHAAPWSTEDVYAESAYLVLHTIDWGQSRNIAKISREPVGSLHHQEGNPFLGTHPSVNRVNEYFILTGLGHVLIADALPKGWRTAFQYISIGVEASSVRHNYYAGVRVSF